MYRFIRNSLLFAAISMFTIACDGVGEPELQDMEIEEGLQNDSIPDYDEAALDAEPDNVKVNSRNPEGISERDSVN